MQPEICMGGIYQANNRIPETIKVIQHLVFFVEPSKWTGYFFIHYSIHPQGKDAAKILSAKVRAR
jgi:hypothetical protein